MRQNFSLTTYNTATLGLVVAVIVGLTASRALISIATGLLLINIVLHINKLSLLKNIADNKRNLSLLIIPLSVLVLIPFSSNLSGGAELLLQKLPFAIIPLSIGLMQKEFLEKFFFKIAGILMLIMMVSGMVVLANYLSNYEIYTDRLRTGIPIPVPNDHVRYSLMMAFVSVMSVYFMTNKGGIFFDKDRKLFAFSAIFSFIMVHILSVRIGLITLYINLIILIIYLSLTRGKLWLSFLLLSVIIFMPVAAYFAVPSFKNRIDYMEYDWQQIKSGNIGHNSDTRRLISLQTGFEMAKQNIWKGSGTGNIQIAVEEFYESTFPEIEKHNRKLPHNQFLYTLVELGLPGLLALIFAFFYPLFFTRFSQHPLFFFLWVSAFISMLVDNTFESQIGTAFYSVFSALFLNFKTEKNG